MFQKIAGILRRNRWQPMGSVAIVTGASSGIGRELTSILASEGCRVIAVARRADRLAELVAANKLYLGDDDTSPSIDLVIPLVGDITDDDVRSRAFEIIDKECGGQLDLLVNNAGVGGIGRFDEADPERMRQIMEVNFFAPTQWTRDALLRMRKHLDLQRNGHGATRKLRATNSPVICNISSVLGHRGVPNKSEYCASKFAIHGWSDSLRAELARDGITVTLVSPSTTRSEFFDALIDTAPAEPSRSIGSWPADRVARATFNAIVARRDEVILSMGGKALVLADRILPTIVNRILAE